MLLNECPRCLIGIDNDFDGNCKVCARWTDEEALRVNLAIRARRVLERSPVAPQIQLKF